MLYPVYPETAQVFTLDFDQSDTTGKWRGLGVLIYGTSGPIHDAAYIGKLSAWAVYPKGDKYMPHMHQVVTLKTGEQYTPMPYGNSWWQGASQLESCQIFRSWKLLPASEYNIRLYFKDGSTPKVFEL